MKLLAIGILCILAICNAEPLLTRKFLEELRSQVDWEVEDYETSVFKGWSKEEFDEYYSSNDNPSEDDFADEYNEVADYLPTHFHIKDKWPKCLGRIRNQGKCGSCWAFGTVEAFSDRYCIASKRGYVEFSPQYIVSCDKTNKACHGGDSDKAFRFLEKHGVVTDSCFPYVSGTNGHVPPCPSKCRGSEKFVKHYCKSGSTKVITNKDAMKTQLMKDGSLATHFLHYEDFVAYKGGIYYHKYGKFKNGHYMKTVGWGVEKGVHYWTIANTYGAKWGEKGFVRVKMGDSGIDKFMVFCTPKV